MGLLISEYRFRQVRVPNRRSRMRYTRLLSALAAVLLAAVGCTSLQRVIGFKDHAARAQATARIDGRIDTEGPSEGMLVVVLGKAAEDPNDQPTGVDTYVRVRPGTYAFRVAPGRYQVGAYEDRNQNGLLDPGERGSRVGESPVLQVGPGETVSRDIILKTGQGIEGLTEAVDVLGLVERDSREQGEFSLWAWSIQGEICHDLNDAAFGPEAGSRGLWEIMDFLNEGIAGIYFMEPYDPDRIPVLFIHGLGGYPRQFSTLIDGLDREKYQPWFYFYPSGFSLDALSTHLATLLGRLQVKHRFDEIAIVAHSMGGLVAQGAIFKYKEETHRDDVRFFVSIATPWGGDVKSRGIEGARIELPASFKDMNPSSDYLNWIFYRNIDRKLRRSLPEAVEYHMIFGFRMAGSSSVANDGTVSVASQARIEAQEQAVTIRAMDYGHVDILHSPEVVARLNYLLDHRF
jgi:pimeloyl-ACP methyl ester carboxylesterase